MIVSVAGAALLSIGFAGVSGQENAMSATTVSAKVAKNKVVGVNSAVYKKVGKKAVKTSAIVRAGSRVTTYGKKTIKGVTYYEIGKGQYIKAANVDGKVRKLAKSTSLYTRNGKAIKGSKMIKGKKVRIFGKAITIHGKKFYATKRGYIPAKALAVKVDDITPTNPATPTTPTAPSANSGAQTPSSTTNIINGGGTSNSNGSNINPPVDGKEFAVKEIDKTANDARNKLVNTKESKNDVSKAIDEVNHALSDAKTVINNADLSSEEIEQIKTQTVNKINGIVAVEEVKDTANDARNKLVNAKEAKEEVYKAVDEVNHALSDAEIVINKGDLSSEEIDQIKTQTVDKINGIVSGLVEKTK